MTNNPYAAKNPFCFGYREATTRSLDLVQSLNTENEIAR